MDTITNKQLEWALGKTMWYAGFFPNVKPIGDTNKKIKPMILIIIVKIIIIIIMITIVMIMIITIIETIITAEN